MMQIPYEKNNARVGLTSLAWACHGQQARRTSGAKDKKKSARTWKQRAGGALTWSVS
jgi:hypothetical protein